jgi:hypothetical protein
MTTKRPHIPELEDLRNRHNKLWMAINAAFKRTFETKHGVDHIVFFYGRRCVEE